MTRHHFSPLRLVFLIAFAFLFASCEKDNAATGKAASGTSLDFIKEKGKLIVLTRNGATTYFEDKDGEKAGLEHDLAVAFASYLGVAIEFETYDSVSEVLHALENRKGHFAAAGLTRTQKREERFLFSAPYQTIQQEVVCEKNVLVDRVNEPADLARVKVLVTAESSYDERLSELSEEFPDIKWETTREASTEQVLQAVSEGEINCTVADSNVLAVHRRYFLDLKPAFSLGEPQELAWVMNPNHTALKAEIDSFLEQYKRSGKLSSLQDQYYGFMKNFDPYDLRIFRERIAERLPKYRALFEEYAKEYGLPWPLLAAVSYQESNWNPTAKSPTGVRGLMMLTKTTAESVGVDDRVDPRQSVMGGAKYLRRVVDRIPNYVDESTRLWMGLASYNVGYYHLRDARALAVFRDKNPNSWTDVKSVLPLLSQRKHYSRLPHGYARGHEPVLYVDRIRNYMDLLITYLSEGQDGEDVNVSFEQ